MNEELILKGLGPISSSNPSSRESDANAKSEELRKEYSLVLEKFQKVVRRWSNLRLRIRIVKSEYTSRNLMWNILKKHIRQWELAFYHVVGRVPTDTEWKSVLKLRKWLLRGKVVHSDSTRVWIDKPGTEEKRPLNVPAISDRIIGKVILDVLSGRRERSFMRTSSGFRVGYDRIKAMIRLMNNLTESKELISADIRKCFDRISHAQLTAIVKRWGLPRGYEQWALSSLKARIRDPETGQVTTPEVGTPQGGVLSPLLCNEALDPLDKLMETVVYDRYADNLLYESSGNEIVTAYLKSIGLEVKAEALEVLKKGSSIVHLGTELVLDDVKKLTVWYERIVPIYERPVREGFAKIRSVLPKLSDGDARKDKAGLTGYYNGKGNILLGMKLVSPYNRDDVWTRPFDEMVRVLKGQRDERWYLAWTGISPYGSTDWYASRTGWLETNAKSGHGFLTDTDRRIVEFLREGKNKSIFKLNNEILAKDPKSGWRTKTGEIIKRK